MTSTIRPVTIPQQIADLMARRDDLHNEMVTSHARTDSTWFMDRVREMDYLNRQLDRLHVRAAVVAG